MQSTNYFKHDASRGITGRAGLIFTIVLLLIFSMAAAPRDGVGTGRALPAGAVVMGYSLKDAAAATANFNVGPRTADTLPTGFPFQILYIDANGGPSDFTVDPGTWFYVPIVYSTSMDSWAWPYPDVNDPAAVSAYYFSPDQLGAEFIRITVDGNTTDLGPASAVGTETPVLPDGGVAYTVAAAFLAPLPKGTHTVTISFRMTGADIKLYPEYFPSGTFEFDATYNVIVK